jgi:hypothetical protein
MTVVDINSLAAAQRRVERAIEGLTVAEASAVSALVLGAVYARCADRDKAIDDFAAYVKIVGAAIAKDTQEPATWQ